MLILLSFLYFQVIFESLFMQITRSPSRALWLIVFLEDRAAKNNNMPVATVYKTSQKMLFLRTKQSVQRPFHMISHVI